MIYLQGSPKSSSLITVNNDSLITGYNDSLSVIQDSIIAVQQKFDEGKRIYEKKCGRCHTLHKPGEYRQKDWKKNVNEMKEKAEISKEEQSLILGYLYSKSKK